MTFDEWQKTTEAYRAGQKSMFGASTTKDKSIAEAIASGEDTTGLSTVRDLARIMLEKKCYWMELAMPVDGKKINLESVITCVDDVPFGSSTTYSPERKAWQASQNAKARATLDSMPYAHLKDNDDGTLTFLSPVPYSRPALPKTCEHCKHWKKPYLNLGHRCENIKVYDMLDGGQSAIFEPLADFGCTLFEVKP
jgi:hypothetical protein